VFSQLGEGDALKVTGCVTSLDGSEHVEHTIEREVKEPEDAEAVGKDLAKVLIESGARKILDDINVERNRRIEEAKAQEEVKAAE